MKEDFLGQNLLNTYFERKSTLIDEEFENAWKDAQDNNYYLSKVTELEEQFHDSLLELNEESLENEGKTIFSLIPKDFVTIDVVSYMTETYNKLFNEKLQKKSELSDLYEEVKAHLMSCNTREEMLEVLSKYGITKHKSIKLAI